MTLSQKTCQACSGDIIAFDAATAQKYLSQLKNWKITEDSKWIFKEFKFKNFLESLEFVKKVAGIAESEGHHPDINFTWGFCKISIQTHKINGLCENDFILGAKIDEVI